MHVITFSQARAGLKQAMDDVCRDHEPTVITRQQGEPVVLLSLEDYNAMEETLYLLSSQENSRRLRESLALHKAGKAFIRKDSVDVAEMAATEQE